MEGENKEKREERRENVEEEAGGEKRQEWIGKLWKGKMGLEEGSGKGNKRGEKDRNGRGRQEHKKGYIWKGKKAERKDRNGRGDRNTRKAMERETSGEK